MAISVTNVASGTTGTAFVQSSSFTSVTGNLYFATCIANKNTAATAGYSPVPATGLGIAWTQINTNIVSTIFDTMALFYGVCTAGATGVIQVNFNTGSTTGGRVIIDSVTGASSSPIIQAVSNSVATTVSPVSIALAAFSDAGNGAYAAWFCSAASPTNLFAPKSGWTTGLILNPAGSNNREATEWIATNDTTPNESWTLSAGNVYGIAVEVGIPITFAKNSLMLLGCGT